MLNPRLNGRKQSSSPTKSHICKPLKPIYQTESSFHILWHYDEVPQSRNHFKNQQNALETCTSSSTYITQKTQKKLPYWNANVREFHFSNYLEPRNFCNLTFPDNILPGIIEKFPPDFKSYFIKIISFQILV